MSPELETHALLRIAAATLLVCDAPPPEWVRAALRRAPWVVVRRAPRRSGLIPVGVRGVTRSERFAAWLPEAAVHECLTPLQLAQQRLWRDHPRRAEAPALAALDTVETVMQRQQLASRWGPTGSVGFELASGCPTATAHSDVDLAVWLDRPLPRRLARALLAQLTGLVVRADVLLETPLGALALTEYAGAAGPWLLRAAGGACRAEDPWKRAAAA
jgi:phosphoribosyl-dephospho-CoA transferase